MKREDYEKIVRSNPDILKTKGYQSPYSFESKNNNLRKRRGDVYFYSSYVDYVDTDFNDREFEVYGKPSRFNNNPVKKKGDLIKIEDLLDS